MSSIVGISSVRLKSENPYELSQWYRKHFGLTFVPFPDMEQYIALVPYRSLKAPGLDGYSFFFIETAKASGKTARALPETVICRVTDFWKIKLSLLGDEAQLEINDDEFLGRCATLVDPEGNIVELIEEQSLVAL